MNKSTVRKSLFILTLTTVAGICIIKETETAAQGIREGLRLCGLTVIPSLFPFLIVSQFITRSGLSGFLAVLFGKPVRKLFGISKECSSVIMMSLIGGYPIGPKMTFELLSQNKISRYDAQRLNLFCINAGPAFVIGTVGNLMLGSTRAGLIIFFSTVAASLTAGFLSKYIQLEDKKKTAESTVVVINDPISSFTLAVSDSVKAMLSICAWVIIFSSVIKCIFSISQSGAASFLVIILEVTNAVRLSIGKFSLPVIAAIISFGGLSVHCQILSYVHASGLELKLFYSSRIICAALSALFCRLILTVFPCEITVFSNYAEISANAYSVSVPSAAALIIMCVLLIFEVDTGKKMC